MLHDFRHQFFQYRNFFFRAFEDQFIVNLQQHVRLKTFFLEDFIHPDHRNFDDICGSALDRRIDGSPFRKGAQIEVAVYGCQAW